MSEYLPELAELPELEATAVRGLRLQDTLLKRMPAVADLGVTNQSMSNWRQMEAEQEMADIRAAYSFSKEYDKRMRAVAKAKDYQASKAAERSGRDVNRYNSKQVRNQAMNSRRSYKQHAAQLGMDRSIFK